MKKILLLFTVFVIIITGCKNNQSKNYQSVGLKNDDSTFLALKDTAQAHIQVFITALDSFAKDTAQYRFAVKSDYVDNDAHEHMWSRIYSYGKGSFKGVFIDSAYYLKNIHYGDLVYVRKENVEDWSIYNAITHKSIGDFSEAYLKSKMKKSNQ